MLAHKQREWTANPEAVENHGSSPLQRAVDYYITVLEAPNYTSLDCYSLYLSSYAAFAEVAVTTQRER